MASLLALAHRIDGATPPDRDRALDGLRALAIAGVVLGHWLVTALVVTGHTVRAGSPLRAVPELAPVSWVFQTLAVFFLVGGLVNARRTGPYGAWVKARLTRLVRPVGALAAVWAVAAGAMFVSGAELETVRTLGKLVVSPLWFLLVFALLTAATPLVSRLHPVWPLAAVASADLVRYGLGGPSWLGWANVVAGWLVPYCLGLAWGRRGLPRGSTGWALLAGGGLAALGLVVWGGYPAAMVGVPGAPVSNLDPPTLAAVAFGLAQCGAAALLAGPLRRLLARPAAWAAVAVVNLSAMTVFLWHQTAMIAVTLAGLRLGGHLPGLHTVPDGLGWVAARLAWLPVFAAVLALCCLLFRVYERSPAQGPGRRMERR
ncbi:acyltransferase [Nonomuraea sp. MCN248]|uniref:Acyltransferase n=1 Tax=Nonomuraea corallina TaxID=2989783 RepID=A0ABT4SEA3_9ACTN|nr:acyltransferase [Nonomuraea corallina]MDA0635522.1 acyltransferase [Nonomuraea corallina]